ncbi:MAG: hypothetical protein QG641_2389, partial [Candidatus Poribacteria bacterium]|nr:hypothetical protein [Candidatus Poribacteria bacterium]
MTPIINAEAQNTNADNSKQPIVFWASGPVQPDETVLLMGGLFHNDSKILIRRLEDIGDTEDNLNDWSVITPLQISQQSLKFVIPEDWKMGVFACRVSCGDLLSSTILINMPDVWWVQGDGGETVSPGGWLRIFGKCLDFHEQTVVRLSHKTSKDIVLPTKKTSCYALYADLPKDIELGEYTVSVYNGFGGK